MKRRKKKLTLKTQGGYEIGSCSNGVEVVLKSMPYARSVSVGMWVRAGGRYEDARLSGISHFVEHLLFKGTRKRTCEKLKQQIEGVGGSLNGFTAEEFTCYMAKVPKRHAKRTITVLADMMCSSVMNKRDVELERGVIIEEIRMFEDSPGQLIHDYINELMWPNHPLGAILSGTIESVENISRRELINYWKRMYQSRSMLVTCTGAFDVESTMEHIEQSFRTLRKLPLRKYSRAPRAMKKSQVRIWNKKTEQTHLCLGTYSVPRSHPDRFALEMLHIIMGANMSSRLFREVREKRGLVYEIGSQIKRFEDTGAFVVYAGCDTSKLVDTVKTIIREFGRIRKDLVSNAELVRAKDYFGGQLEMGLEDTMDHMMWVGEQVISSGRIAKVDALMKRLKAVRASDIQRVARRLFKTSNLHLAIIGPLDTSKEAEFAKLCRIQ